jgi:hypothetical protein
MNDPWSTLVETLSGTPRKTPSGWPARTVHRMMDDAPLVVLQPKKLPPPLVLANTSRPGGQLAARSP